MQDGGQDARSEDPAGDSGIFLPVDYSSGSDEDPTRDVSISTPAVQNMSW